MIDLFCANCNVYLGDSGLFHFYENFQNYFSLMVKLDQRDLFLEKYGTLKNKKITCQKCHQLIGNEKMQGPKKEPLLCLLKDALYFIKASIESPYFGRNVKWPALVNDFKELGIRKTKDFYNIEKLENGQKDAKIPKIETPISDTYFQKFKYKCKFTLQAYLCETGERDLEEFEVKLKDVNGFRQMELVTSNTYLSNEIENCITYNCYFEIEYNEEIIEAEQVYAFNTILKLSLGNIKNQAFIWLQKKQDKPSTNIQSNESFICRTLEFGNLKTPFEFLRSENKQVIDGNVKFSVLFDIRCIAVLAFVGNILHKFEIEFNIIESFICIDEDNTSLNVYIPCKRPTLVYRTTSDYNIYKLSLANFDEENLEVNWERGFFKNHDWSLKLKFNLADKFRLMKTLETICFNRILLK